MLLTTIESIPGRDVSEVIGLVVACVPTFGSKYAEGIADVTGLTARDVPAALERRRIEVLDRLSMAGVKLHADAIVGVQMDTREITASWKELCAYGTAVRLR